MDNTIPTIEPSLDVVVRQIHTDLGRRASIGDVLAVLEAEHSDTFAKNARTAMKSKIRNALTDHGPDGLPFAGAIGDRYVQRDLFSVEHYETKISEYVDRAGDNLDVAHRLSDECVEKFGVRFTVPTLDVDARSEAS